MEDGSTAENASADARRETPESAGERASPFEGVTHEFHKLAELVSTSVGAATSLGQLAAAEVVLAASMVPRILSAGLLLIPLAMLFWLGFSVSVAYYGYTYWNDPLAGLVVFTALQFLVIVVLLLCIRSWKNKMKLRKTRQQISAFSEARQT